MLWCYELAERAGDRPQLINDSKTPSGRVHVGALRGVLIHDAVYRVLRERGVPVQYRYGVDDCDPLDELPAGQEDFFRPHLGRPLCDVPAPPGSGASDVAAHYIRELLDVFGELGVGAEPYWMRDVYRSGAFNGAIDTILRGADEVRRVYLEVSGSERPPDWLPLQVVCERCGRVGTTRAAAYDGREVRYRCEPRLVRWAEGCGHEGRVSPFDGRAKLPFKLEWVAKWHVFGVTIEGAGKDHSTKGGTRDVAAACLRRLFGEEPPLDIPYEFFLVGGAKMSSSRGVGASAREMADLLTPEALRFLMLRTRPQRPVDFRADEAQIARIYSDLDRHHRAAFEAGGEEDARRIYRLSEVTPEDDYFVPGFPLVLTLVQMPHLDVEKEIERRKGGPLSEPERRHLQRRVAAARTWLERWASPEERTVLQESLPQRAHELGAVERAFLHELAGRLREAPWEDDAIQAAAFDAARLTPIPQRDAFRAIYRVFFDRDSGPRAGSVLAFLDRDFVLARLCELPGDEAGLLERTARPPEEVERWLEEHAGRIREVRVRARGAPPAGVAPERLAVAELEVRLDDGKTHRKRVRISGAEGGVEEAVQRYVQDLSARTGVAALDSARSR